MGMILGYVCLVCFVGMIAKAVTRKLGFQKGNAMLMKLHKLLSAGFLLSGIAHFVLVLPVLRTRAVGVTMTGSAMLLLGVLLIVLCHVMKKNGKRWLRVHRIMAAFMLVCMFGHMAIYFADFGSYQKKMESIELQSVDTSRMADGEYIGEFDAGYIYAKVKVTLKDGKMQDILLLEHRNERGSAAESVVNAIVEQQTFPVDAVSGATNSGKVIQKAVENALEKAGEHNGM